jgi:hypothetical protein
VVLFTINKIIISCRINQFFMIDICLFFLCKNMSDPIKHKPSARKLSGDDDDIPLISIDDVKEITKIKIEKTNFGKFDLMIKDENVISLDKICVDRGQVIGCVNMINIGHSKNVFIRYTWDNWETYNDKKCSKISLRSSIDQYKFDIPISFRINGKVKLNSYILEFALCGIVDEMEFWNDLEGKNHIIQLIKIE